jgi:hypothetical protein
MEKLYKIIPITEEEFKIWKESYEKFRGMNSENLKDFTYQEFLQGVRKDYFGKVFKSSKIFPVADRISIVIEGIPFPKECVISEK